MVFNWEQFFRDNNISYITQGKNVSQGWIACCCPHHARDVDYYLGVHKQTGALWCWLCNRVGGLETIEKLLGIQRDDARRIYSQYLVRRVPGGGESRDRHVGGAAVQIELPPVSFTEGERKYLHRRRLDNPKTLSVYDLRGGGRDGDWRYRIVIPIVLGGHVVSATGRAIADIEPKYWTLPRDRERVHHKETFLGIDRVYGRSLVVVEGPIDAIRGGSGFVSSFGTSITDAQLAVLSHYEHVMFLLDNDEGGRRAVDRYANALAAVSNTAVEAVYFSGEKDVGAMTDSEIKDLRSALDLLPE